MVQDNITRYINNINELLVSHENMVKLDAHGNLLSRAVLSEIFYCDFLNALMGWRLENANIERKNAPGIDLIDATNKVAAQVSLTCDHEKIQSSIDIFDKNWSRGSSVWHFYFVPLSDRVPDFKVDFDIPAGIVFDKSTDVLTKERIMTLAMTPFPGELNVDRLKSVSETLDKLMREQKEHYEVCNYLFEVLKEKRASHPSFTLLGNDDIDRRLFPEIEESKDRVLMPAMGEKDGASAPIWDLIEEEQKEGFRHIVIEGTGGIGKSVSLLSVTDKEELLMRIPAIYIHMYDLVSNGTFITIWEHIQKYYIHLDTITHMVSRAGKPKLMVLLDGLNEVAYEMQTRLSRDIQSWAESNPGVQLIIASRPIPGKQLEYMFGPKTRSIRLKQLDWNDVQQYLALRDIPVPEESSKLGETIKLPLFLTLYAKTAKLNGKEAFEGCPLHVREAVGPASLIWNYLQRELLKQQTRDDAITCALSCELLAPYIAYRMEARNLFEIGCEQADDLVAEAVALLDANHLPRHASSALKWFKRQTHGAKPLPGTNWARRVLDECGIFVPPKKKNSGLVSDGQKSAEADYTFMHQNFRDCLAALHLVNAAEAAEGALAEEWRKSIRHEVLAYSAELMEKDTAAKLWELNRVYTQYTGKRAKDNASTYMQLELNRLLGTPGDRLDFSGMDLRGMSLTNYMGSGHDLGLFGKSGLSNNTHIDRKVFEHAGHTGSVNCLAVLPDGRIVSGSEDHTLRIWNPDTGACLRTLEGHVFGVNCLAVLPDGRIVSGSDDRTLSIWNPDTAKCLYTLIGHAKSINCLAVLPDGRIVSGSSDKTLRIWDPDTGKCLWVLRKRPAVRTRFLANLPDGRILCGSKDGTLFILDSNAVECLQMREDHDYLVTCLAVLPDGRIVVGSTDGILRIWNPNTEKCLQKLRALSDLITCLAILPDGRIVVGSTNGILRIWNPDTGEHLQTSEGHADLVSCLAVLPDGRIISGSRDKTLRIWDSDTGDCLKTLTEHVRSARCLAVLPDGRLVSGLHDNTLRIWNADTGECLQTLKGHTDLVRCLTVLSESRIVSGSYDATLRVWNVNTGKWQPLEGHTYAINCLTVFRDKRIVGGSYDATLRVWNADTGEYIGSLEGHTDWLRCLAVLSDQHIISGSRDTTIRVWDPDTGECMRTLTGHTDSVNCLAILPDGHIVSGSSDETIRIWDVDTSDCLKQIKTRTGWRRWLFSLINMIMGEGVAEIIARGIGPINCLAILHDKSIVSGSDDGIVRVWDVDTEKCLQKLKGHTGSVNCLTVLQNGYIVSGSDDSTIRIWDADTGKCLNILEAAEVDVSNMFFSNAVMDDDTKRILYQNMAKDHGEFAKIYRDICDKRLISRLRRFLFHVFGLGRPTGSRT